MEKYKVIKQLGEGAYGVVLKCINTETQEVVAIKRMKQKMSWNEALQLREVQALQNLGNHPNVVKIKEMALKDQQLNIVFEYCDRNLFQLMQERSKMNKPFTNEEVRDLAFQAVSALAYIHKNGFMHRDIKPENFLLIQQNGYDTLKLADFGLARSLKDKSTPLTEYVSTRWYRAPELVLHSKTYNQSVDIFAVGCMMAEMYLGRPIFPGKTESDQITAIVSVLGTPKLQDWSEGYKLIQQIGQSFPNFQYSSLTQQLESAGASAHAINLLSQMFLYDGSKRISVNAALKHEFFKGVQLVTELQGPKIKLSNITLAKKASENQSKVQHSDAEKPQYSQVTKLQNQTNLSQSVTQKTNFDEYLDKQTQEFYNGQGNIFQERAPASFYSPSQGTKVEVRQSFLERNKQKSPYANEDTDPYQLQKPQQVVSPGVLRQTKFSSFGTSIIDTQENSNTYGKMIQKPSLRNYEVPQVQHTTVKDMNEIKISGNVRVLSREGGSKPDLGTQFNKPAQLQQFKASNGFERGQAFKDMANNQLFGLKKDQQSKLASVSAVQLPLFPQQVEPPLGGSFKPHRNSNFVPQFQRGIQEAEDDEWPKPAVGKVVPANRRQQLDTANNQGQIKPVQPYQLNSDIPLGRRMAGGGNQAPKFGLGKIGGDSATYEFEFGRH